MNPKAKEITKKQLITLAKKKDIKEPHKMSTKNLLPTLNRYEKSLQKLRRIKNYDELLKEDLIYTLLRTEENILEDYYMKRISNTADNEIRKNINIARERTAQLSNILTKEERRIIREELYKLEKQERFSKKQRKKAPTYLIDLARTLDAKEKYHYTDY